MAQRRKLRLIKGRHRQPGDAAERANRLILRRTLVVMLVCGIGLFIPLVATLCQLMIVDHDQYEQWAINNQTRSTVLTSSRGVIYDRNMNILASNATVETIFLDPNALARRIEEEAEKREAGKEYNPAVSVDFIAKGLADLLDVETDFVKEQAADTAYYYKVIKRKVPEETAQEVRDFIAENDLSGIINLELDSRRYYPYGSLAAQVLGFVNLEDVGGEGLEAYYEATLTGNAGAIITTKGNRGTEMLYTYEKYYDASDGNSLVLTLDMTVQYYLEKNLEEAIEKYDVLNGAFGMVMDVDTGEILGMATLGSYDPNNWQEIYDEDLREELENQYQAALRAGEGTQAYTDGMAAYNAAVATARLRQWRNRCVSDGYEPGSTFKPITLATGLDTGAVTGNDTYECTGSYKFEGRDQIVSCWKAAGHGSQTTMEALGNSCNIAFSNMGLKIGAQTFYEYFEAFGFREKTGIDLPGEAEGIFFPYEQFTQAGNNANLISSSWGQTFKITPIQLVRATAALVNGGYLLEPHVVKEVLDSDGNVVSRTETKVIRQVISQETSDIMCEMYEYVVSGGTASGAQVPGYRIGGKTGTSEKIDVYDENGVQVDDKMVSFIGIAPMEDPKYVVLVVLDTPSEATGLYISGGIMAAPTVGAVFGDILPYLGVEPNYTDEELELVSVEVPNVVGMTEAEAAAALDQERFTYRTVGSGATVQGQIPAAGTMIPGKSEVVLYFGQDAPTDTVEVPDFSGMTLVYAQQYAESKGLYLLVTGTNQDRADVTATYQDVEPGTEVPLGTTITVEFTNHSAQD